MPEYLHPGVYIEEIERGPRPIEGVPDEHGGLPRRGRARLDHAAPRHQLQGLPALVRRRVRRRQVPAVRGQRVLRERRQARVHLPPRRRRRDSRRSGVRRLHRPRRGAGRVGHARVREDRPTARRKKPDGNQRRLPPAARVLERPGAGFDPFAENATTLPRPHAHRGLRRSRHRRDVAGLLRQARAVHRSRQGRHQPGTGELGARRAGPQRRRRRRRAPGRRRHAARRRRRRRRRRSASTTSRDRRRLRRAGAARARGARARSVSRRRARLRARSSSTDIAQGDHRALREHALPLRGDRQPDKGQSNPSGLNPRNTITDSQLRRVLLPVDRRLPIRAPARAS